MAVRKKKIPRNVKKMTPREQHQFAAKTMAVWETEAKKDGRYNLGREEANCAVGNKILCEFYKREVEWDETFGKKREKITNHEREMVKHGI